MPPNFRKKQLSTTHHPPPLSSHQSKHFARQSVNHGKEASK